MYSIPQAITINNKSYAIREKGDYRMVLDCFKALNDEELDKTERVVACLMIFYEDFNSIQDVANIGDLEPFVKEMYNFFNCGEESGIGMKVPHKLIDWERDSQIISSAINKVAGKEIRAESYVHWWTFMGYYLAVGESPLATIVGIRSKIVKGKKLDKSEQEFKRNNPQYFNWNAKTIEQKEADELARQLWNSGK